MRSFSNCIMVIWTIDATAIIPVIRLGIVRWSMLVARRCPEFFPTPNIQMRPFQVLLSVRGRRTHPRINSPAFDAVHWTRTGFPCTQVQLDDHWQVDFGPDDQTWGPTMFCGEGVHGQVELIIKRFLEDLHLPCWTVAIRTSKLKC